jgi:hypothetical protein
MRCTRRNDLDKWKYWYSIYEQVWHPCLYYPRGVRIFWLIMLLSDVSWFRFLIHSFLTSGERHPTDRQCARSRFVCFLGRHALHFFLVASCSIWSICPNQSWLLGHKRHLQSVTKIKGKENVLSNKSQGFFYQFPLNLRNWVSNWRRFWYMAQFLQNIHKVFIGKRPTLKLIWSNGP